MKTFDEYIQGRIWKAYKKAEPVVKLDKQFSNFKELADWLDGFSIQVIAGGVFEKGIGKQRAKDYAHYIVAYLEETEWVSLETHPEKHIPIWIACNVFMDDFPRVVIGYWNGAGYKSIDDGLSINYPRAWTTYTAEKPRYPQVDNSQENERKDAQVKSHLTDEDSKHIKNLAKEMVNAYSLQHQDNTTTKLINFINSLKGE